MTAKILFLDVDGCLSKGRFTAFNLEKLDEVRRLIKSLGWNVVLSSGRSQPYMEAMTQALDLSTPYICENGACIFSTETGEYIYVNRSPELSAYRDSLESLDIGTLQFEPGKDNSLSFRVLRQGELVAAHEIAGWLAEHCLPPSTLRVTYSSCSIDVVPVNVNKESAAKFLVDTWHTDLQACHAFGDSNNDIELLRAVGHAGAPANASPVVKELVDFVSEHSDVEGLIDYLKVMSAK